MARSIGSILEGLVIADLSADVFIGQYAIHPHDYTLQKSGDAEAEQPFVIAVTALDHGDWDRVIGSGIRKIQLEVEINANVQAEDYAEILDELEGRISGRLQPSTTIVGVTGREDAFSDFSLKTYGILSTQETLRHDIDLTRQRVVQRLFCCVQLA